MQTQGAITFPCPLGEEVAKVEYLNETKVAESGLRPNCPGSGTKPEAKAGFLCVFNSALAVAGSKDNEFVNAEETTIESTNGEQGKTSKVGALVVFKTTEYEEGVIGHTIAKAAVMSAGGAWAVKELK